ncbi:MAG: oligosaccharide flippase family protein [Syntrophaceae bacterium]|nr:oligosaccharide flippase family protein [Syntrophaceae bacterium]
MIKKEVKFLLSHSAIYSLGTLAAQLVGFFLLPVYTRYLTPEEYGIIEMVTLTNSVIGVFLSFGVSAAIVRFFYSQDDDKYRKSVISTTSIIYSASALGFGILLFNMVGIFSRLVFSSEQYAGLLKISFAYLLVGGFNNIGDTYFRVMKKPFLYVTISMSRLILLISLNIYFVVFVKTGIVGILNSTLIVNIVFALIVSMPIVVKTRTRFNIVLAREMLMYSLPMVPANIMRIVINQSDRFFITNMLSLADTGIFGIAVKIGNAILILIGYPFNLTFMQRRFEIVKRKDAQVVFTKVFTYFSLLMLFMGLVITVFIHEVLVCMTTPAFYKAAVLVPFVVFYSIIFSFRFHFDFGIFLSKKTHLDIYINSTVLIISIIANYYCIKYMGLMGAIYAKTIVTVLHTSLYYFIAGKCYKVRYEFKKVFSAVGIGLLIYVMSVYVDMGTMVITIFVKIGLMGLYVLTLRLLNIIEKEEYAYVKNVISGCINRYIFRESAI